MSWGAPVPDAADDERSLNVYPSHCETGHVIERARGMLERRTFQRYLSQLSGNLLFAGHEKLYHISIRDISRGGSRIRLSHDELKEISANRRISLLFGNERVDGTILDTRIDYGGPTARVVLQKPFAAGTFDQMRKRYVLPEKETAIIFKARKDVRDISYEETLSKLSLVYYSVLSALEIYAEIRFRYYPGDRILAPVKLHYIRSESPLLLALTSLSIAVNIFRACIDIVRAMKRQRELENREIKQHITIAVTIGKLQMHATELTNDNIFLLRQSCMNLPGSPELVGQLFADGSPELQLLKTRLIAFVKRLIEGEYFDIDFLE